MMSNSEEISITSTSSLLYISLYTDAQAIHNISYVYWLVIYRKVILHFHQVDVSLFWNILWSYLPVQQLPDTGRYNWNYYLLLYSSPSPYQCCQT